MWHEFLYQMKYDEQQSGKPAFQADMRFDWDGPAPKSRDLSAFFSVLFVSGCFEARSPGFDGFTIAPGVATLWKRNQPDPALMEWLDYAAECLRLFPSLFQNSS